MTTPNQYNVSLGDLLITFLHDNSLVRLIVTETTPEGVSAFRGNLATAISYQEAIIIRKENGTYLIGENAWARLLGELGNGFGGIRLVK